MKIINKFAVGIIDKDKRVILYLGEFSIVDRVESSLTLLKHKTKPQFLIQIRPALEVWILDVCEAEEIELTNFGLINDLENFKRYTKRLSSIENEKLKALFREIGKRDNNEDVRKLKWGIKV